MKEYSEEFIDECASDFDIRYALCGSPSAIYVGYYDPQHRLKVAKRTAWGEWQYVLLPETVNWDSHKFITMIEDREGYVHLCAGMHCTPLIYYRMQNPGDIHSFKKSIMTGEKEERVTYPEFLQTDETLYFHYREGKSGNGSTYVNRYDAENKKWIKQSSLPLFDGLERSNAYFKGPWLGPDGRFHVIWCWRDTPDCTTNHGLYYAFSFDFKKWHSPSGYMKSVPLTPDDSGFLVDDIKKGEGLINGGYTLGFRKKKMPSGNLSDEQWEPFIGYHKYDTDGNTNIFLATVKGKEKEQEIEKPENWKIIRLTNWSWRWNFAGRGSIPFLLDIYKAGQDTGGLNIRFGRKIKRGLFSLSRMRDFIVSYNDVTGDISEKEYAQVNPEILKPKNRGMLLHLEEDRNAIMKGSGKDGEVKMILRYETVFPARDKRKRRRKHLGHLKLLIR